MAGGQFEAHGGQPQKQPKFVPVFVDRCFTGIYSQRNVLHDPSDFVTSKFYGGRPDALWQGKNIELTNRLTLQRRPGLSEFSTATYPTPPLRAFSFQLIDGTIQVIIDTDTTALLSVTSVDNASTGTTVYNGVFPDAGSNAYVGMLFLIAGFTNGANNGAFIVTASTTTTLTLANAGGVAETAAATGISAGAVYVDNQDGTKTLLFPKSPGAGQTYFVAVAGVLYMGDGVDVRKYTPLDTNGTIWNWGGAAPLNQPNVTITEAAASSVPWQANTWFSTMGIIIDSNENAQQLISVDASGTNSTQFGISGNGQPPWNQSPGGSTPDGTITWENKSPVGTWSPNTTFGGTGSFGTLADPAVIYDVNSNSYFENSRNAPTQSGSTKPPFAAGPGNYFDGGCNWVWLGTAVPNTPPGHIVTWAPSTAYGNPLAGGSGGVVIEPANPPVTNQTSYAQFVTTPGTSNSGYSSPSWSTGTGQTTTPDGNLSWINLGSSVWAPNTDYFGWSSPTNNNFSCVVDSVGQLQVCIQTGISGSSAPWHVWVALAVVPANTTIIDSNGNKQFTSAGGTSGGTTPSWSQTVGSSTTDGSVTWVCTGVAYGFTTTDGTAIWVCVGSAAQADWVVNQIYYLPKVGFSPPTQSSAYGGALVVDSNGDEEFVVSTGVTGSSVPTWLAPGDVTVDNTVKWFNNGTAIITFISWTVGYNYAYSYKARSLTDFYSVDVAGTSTPPIPPGLTNPLPPPTGSETGLITTASPAYTITGGNSGAVNTITGIGSTDPQFDTIVIWRSADGGSSGEMFELTEIPMPPPVGGVGQPWNFVDFLPDTPTNLYPGLNPLIPAPIDDSNNPPPSNFLPMVYNFERIWGANGQSAQFSGGPDVVTGNPNEAFNPIDSLPFLANVVRLVKTSQGLVTFLTDSIEFIAGGPSTASFYSVTLAPGTGLLSYNALDQFAGEIYFFSSDNRLVLISPSLNMSNSGFPIGDQLANLPSSGVSDTTWNPSKVYVAILQNGIDNCLIISDGSTGWYRQNPHQVPGGAQGPEPIWSPFAAITNGCKMVQTVETTPGIKQLLVGAVTANQKILYRDLSVFTDDGTEYDAFFIMGSIGLALPGQLAILKFLEMDMSGVNFEPTISYLLDEVSGTFTPFTLNPVFDPPSLYGTTITPGSYSPQRYYFSGTGSLARCRHLQIKVEFGQTSVANEIFNLTIFGRLFVEL